MAPIPTLDDNSLYIFLKSRGTPGKRHAVNNETTGDVWALLSLSSSAAETLLRNPLTVLLYKLCPLVVPKKKAASSEDWDGDDEDDEHEEADFSDVKLWEKLDSTIRGVATIGSVSERTGEEFSCRTWVLDALDALAREGFIPAPEKGFDCLAGECVGASVKAEKAGIGRGKGKVRILGGRATRGR